MGPLDVTGTPESRPNHVPISFQSRPILPIVVLALILILFLRIFDRPCSVDQTIEMGGKVYPSPSSTMEAPPNVSGISLFVCVCIVVMVCVLHVVWFVPSNDHEKHRKEMPKTIWKSPKVFKKNVIKWRLGAPRSASCGILRRLRSSEWLFRPIESAWNQPSVPKKACRRVARWPLGHPSDTFLKPGGVIFLKKRR